MSQAETRGEELRLGLSRGWQGLKYLGHLHSFSRHISGELDQKQASQVGTRTPIWDVTSQAVASPLVPLFIFFEVYIRVQHLLNDFYVANKFSESIY